MALELVERLGLEALTLRDLGFVHGSIFATCVLGLFEDPDLVASITGIRPISLQLTFDRLADLVDAHLNIDGLLANEIS